MEKDNISQHQLQSQQQLVQHYEQQQQQQEDWHHQSSMRLHYGFAVGSEPCQSGAERIQSEDEWREEDLWLLLDLLAEQEEMEGEQLERTSTHAAIPQQLHEAAVAQPTLLNRRQEDLRLRSQGHEDASLHWSNRMDGQEERQQQQRQQQSQQQHHQLQQEQQQEPLRQHQQQQQHTLRQEVHNQQKQQQQKKQMHSQQQQHPLQLQQIRLLRKDQQQQEPQKSQAWAESFHGFSRLGGQISHRFHEESSAQRTEHLSLRGAAWPKSQAVPELPEQSQARPPAGRQSAVLQPVRDSREGRPAGAHAIDDTAGLVHNSAGLVHNSKGERQWDDESHSEGAREEAKGCGSEQAQSVAAERRIFQLHRCDVETKTERDRQRRASFSANVKSLRMEVMPYIIEKHEIMKKPTASEVIRFSVSYIKELEDLVQEARSQLNDFKRVVTGNLG